MAEKPQVQRWDLLMRVASLGCTAVLLPGIGWAFSVSTQMSNLEGRINMLASQIDSERRGSASVIEELRQLRTSVDTLKSDILQRIAKVETKLENR
jgi:hypothetical protein